MRVHERQLLRCLVVGLAPVLAVVVNLDAVFVGLCVAVKDGLAELKVGAPTGSYLRPPHLRPRNDRHVELARVCHPTPSHALLDEAHRLVEPDVELLSYCMWIKYEFDAHRISREWARLPQAQDLRWREPGHTQRIEVSAGHNASGHRACIKGEKKGGEQTLVDCGSTASPAEPRIP